MTGAKISREVELAMYSFGDPTSMSILSEIGEPVAAWADSYLLFRRKREVWFEMIEAMLIAVILGLEYLRRHEISEELGFASHVLSAVLIGLKVVSIIAIKIRVRWFGAY
jgi:hypothetical protein